MCVGDGGPASIAEVGPLDGVLQRLSLLFDGEGVASQGRGLHVTVGHLSAHQSFSVKS